MNPNRIIRLLLITAMVKMISYDCFAGKENSDFLYCINQIKQMKACMYDYVLTVKFHDGSTENIKGQSYFDIAKQYVYNTSPAATILYDGTWYYNANHLRKVVTIFKMDRRFRTGVADSIRNEVFQMGVYSEWMDSLVLKYGNVQTLVKVNSIAKFDILFRPNSFIRKISIEFDMKTNLIRKCDVEAYFSLDNDGDNEQKSVQTMSCTNYKREPDTDETKMEKYFTLSNSSSSIKLLRYKNYKLITTK